MNESNDYLARLQQALSRQDDTLSRDHLSSAARLALAPTADDLSRALQHHSIVAAHDRVED